MAAILEMARRDMEAGSPGCALHAYTWVESRAPMFRIVCTLIDLDAERVRARLLALYGARCEGLRRRLVRKSGNVDAAMAAVVADDEAAA